MRIYRPILLALSFFAAVTANTLAAEPGAAAELDFTAVRNQIQLQMIAENLPSVAVAIARGGNIIWEEGFGWADTDKRIPATEHTVYSLASISKPITATGLMVLVERGLIDLDAPINHYLGDAKLVAHVGNADEATVRRVANHTSGLPLHYQFFYEDEERQRPGMDESIERYGHLVSVPGEKFEYSNFGYGLLDYAIERVSGRSYAEFMLEEVFTPLGMTRTAVNRHPDFGELVAVRYTPDRSVVPFYDFDHRGASAVFASAHDLVRFGMFNLKNHLPDQKPILTDAGLDEMHKPTIGRDEFGYGAGWVSASRNGVTTLSHSGGMGGVSTRLILIPEHDIAMVVLVNARTDAGKITTEIIKTLLPETVENAFKPQAELVGDWQGVAKTYTGEVAVAVRILASGIVEAKVGDAPFDRVPAVTVGDEMQQQEDVLVMSGFRGQLPTPDAEHYPYVLQLKLKQREDVLNGALTALSFPMADRTGNATSHWVELRNK